MPSWENGTTIEIVPLPMPAPLWFDGQRLPASYANFYIGNAVVLVPTFNDPKDRVALGILSEMFPDRSVIGIHAVDLLLGFGDAALSDATAAPVRERRGADDRPRGVLMFHVDDLRKTLARD